MHRCVACWLCEEDVCACVCVKKCPAELRCAFWIVYDSPAVLLRTEQSCARIAPEFTRPSPLSCMEVSGHLTVSMASTSSEPSHSPSCLHSTNMGKTLVCRAQPGIVLGRNAPDQHYTKQPLK